MSRLTFLVLPVMLVITGCFVMENKYSGLPPGIWRATLILDSSLKNKPEEDLPAFTAPKYELEDVLPGELPFNFEVIYENDSIFFIEIINGEERIKVESQNISFGRNKERARDTVRIDFPSKQAYIIGYFASNTIEGSWVVLNKENYSIPFVAMHGKKHRFTTTRKPNSSDLSGTWNITLNMESENQEPALIELGQNGNLLLGNFESQLFSYPNLEGTAQGNYAWLSCFDGANAYLFEMKLQPDSTLIGALYVGTELKITWEGLRNSTILK